MPPDVVPAVVNIPTFPDVSGQGSSAGESVRLIIVRSRVRLPPLVSRSHFEFVAGRGRREPTPGLRADSSHIGNDAARSSDRCRGPARVGALLPILSRDTCDTAPGIFGVRPRAEPAPTSTPNCPTAWPSSRDRYDRPRDLPTIRTGGMDRCLAATHHAADAISPDSDDVVVPVPPRFSDPCYRASPSLAFRSHF